jgi:hypothetical protein
LSGESSEVIPRNVAEERALPPQSNFVKTFVMVRAAPVPGSGKRLKVCRFRWLRGTEKLLKFKNFFVSEVQYVPNVQFLSFPFRGELIHSAG